MFPLCLFQFGLDLGVSSRLFHYGTALTHPTAILGGCSELKENRRAARALFDGVRISFKSAGEFVLEVLRPVHTMPDSNGSERGRSGIPHHTGNPAVFPAVLFVLASRKIDFNFHKKGAKGHIVANHQVMQVLSDVSLEPG